MKKNKIIGIAVATLGVIISTGVSLALYVSKDAAKEIGIGVFTPHVSQNGDINYVIDTVTAGAQNAAFSPDHLQNTHSFRLGASKGADSQLPLQNYTVGDLTITISSANTTLISKLTAAGTIAVPSGKWQDVNSNGKVNLTVDKAQDNSSITLTYANFTAQSVKDLAGGTNSIVDLELTLANNLTEQEVLALAEANYSISASWVEPSNFVYAYITGTQYGWATEETDSRMVPNALATSFEWMYTGYRDTTPGDSRGAKPIMKDDNNTWRWSTSADTAIALDKQYDFYWSGLQYQNNEQIPTAHYSSENNL